jgi:hypothetical protein
MTMVIVYFSILQQNLWINISFDEDTVGNIIHGTIWALILSWYFMTYQSQVKLAMDVLRLGLIL